jgi:hypothetical protein
VNFRARDYESTQFIAIFSGISAMILLYNSWGRIPAHALAFSLGVALAIVCVGSLAYAQWTQVVSGPWPNKLSEKFGKAVVEEDGVQFAAVAAQRRVQPGERVLIQVFLQNTWDRVRNVKIDLSPRRSADTVRRPEITYALRAGEVVKLSIESTVEVLSGQSLELEFSIVVWGGGGRRVRRWRAAQYQPRVSGAHQATMLAVGVIAWGGGVRFRFESVAGRAASSGAPSTKAETLWLPAATFTRS